jgi:flagellar motility protein MotE (MotC chaperone)
MNLLTKPWFAAVLILLLQPVVAGFLIWKSAPGLVTALVVAAAPAEEPMRPREARAPWNMWTPELEKIAAELKEQRTALQDREQALSQREARVTAEQAELVRTRKEIELQRAEIARMLTEISADEMKNLRTLAQTYASLSPKAAVAIFSEMDDSTVVKILSLMKSDVVGPVFEEMAKDPNSKNSQAQRAAVLSERLRLMKSTKTTNGARP